MAPSTVYWGLSGRRLRKCPIVTECGVRKSPWKCGPFPRIRADAATSLKALPGPMACVLGAEVTVSTPPCPSWTSHQGASPLLSGGLWG